MKKLRETEIVLTPDSARRIAAAVRAVEAMPAGSAAGRTSPRINWPAKVFKVTTQITAAVDADTPGVGNGTLRTFNASTGKFTDTAVTGVPIYNLTSAKIIVGATVQCVVVDGRWFYDVTACANGI